MVARVCIALAAWLVWVAAWVGASMLVDPHGTAAVVFFTAEAVASFGLGYAGTRWYLTGSK